MTDLIFIVVGMLAWLGITLLFGEWMLRRSGLVQHQVSGDGPPWITSSDNSETTIAPPRSDHAN